MLLMIMFLVISSFLGYKAISKVPPLLHTPLMSGMNALSGIIALGALIVFTESPDGQRTWAGIALILAMTNVAGGFWVTERMLRMFRK